VFWLPAASVALFAATSTVIVPSAEGVIVAVYVVPLPDRLEEPPPTVMSPFTKLLVDSLNVMVTSKVEDVTGFEALDVMVTVGDCVSYVHEYVFETLLSLPAPSLNLPAATATEAEPSEDTEQVAV